MRSILLILHLYFTFIQSFSLSSTTIKRSSRSCAVLSAQHPPIPELHQDTETSKEAPLGTYAPYATHAWEQLTQSPAGSFLEPVPIEEEYSCRRSQPIGPSQSTTSIQIRALQSTAPESPIRYARYALLETQPVSSNSIQVLNLCIFPAHKHVPVLGADFVSLPGNKHLLLLDAQPMNGDNDMYASRWSQWHADIVGDGEEAIFPWGGDLPEKVQPFVSEYALWTRLGGEEDVSSLLVKDGPLYKAFCEHLDIYLNVLMDESSGEKEPHEQEDYIKYRVENDPARPMLRRLYGEEWTEHVLDTYLFPQT